jgi:two-component system chemotaxis sensor kinase CheA
MGSEYLDLFKKESLELIKKMDDSLLQLERNPDNKEAINDFFRGAHSIKGISASMEFDSISNLAHSMEDIVSFYRRGSKPKAAELDLLFSCVDMLREMIEKSGTEELDKLDSSLLINQLQTHIQKYPVSEKPEKKEKKTPPVAPLKAETGEKKEEEKKEGEREEEKKERIEPAEKKAVEEEHEPKKEPAKEKTEEEPEKEREKEKETKISEVTEKVKESEALPGALPKIKKIETIKIDVKFLDELMDLIGELLINKNRLLLLANKYNIKELDETLNQLQMLLDDLQKDVFRARLLPLNTIFEQFPRVARDLARSNNKKVDLYVEGGNIDIDKAILDSLPEPLIHLIRNAVDHGIEPPTDRIKAGKSEIGKIWLRAKRGENSIIIEIEDDGKGVNLDKIRNIGLERGLIDQSAGEEEILNLMFLPGFSAADKVTKVSGRGVGLDVVKQVVESLKGAVQINTNPGRGTKFTLVFPFTTAISKALIIKVGEERYGILLDDIQSSINLSRITIRNMENRKVVLLRERVAPLVNLRELFLGESSGKQGTYGIVIQDESKIVVLEADDILSQQELVVRSLPPYVRKTKYFSGTAILGDGMVILTLNPGAILSSEKSDISGK